MLMEEELTGKTLGAAIEVHASLGPGLLESAYEQCLCHELGLRGIAFERQVELPVKYKGVMLSCGYRLDLVVQDVIVIELKAVERLLPIHEAQLLTYLRLTGCRLGLLVNFGENLMKDGFKRVVNGLED